MRFVEQPEALHIVGLELRTSNDKAVATIPPHWEQINRNSVLTQIPGRLTPQIFAVYTNFEHAGSSNEGIYSLVIGARVAAAAPVPAGLVRVVIPASRRAVFPVKRGRMDLVGEAWHAVWQRTDIAKTYLADYERYDPDGVIEIVVGVQRKENPGK